MFDTAIKGMHVDRGEVLMIGDRMTTDILGARRAGIKSVLVRAVSLKKAI